jgi:hypothetical protein
MELVPSLCAACCPVAQFGVIEKRGYVDLALPFFHRPIDFGHGCFVLRRLRQGPRMALGQGPLAGLAPEVRFLCSLLKLGFSNPFRAHFPYFPHNSCTRRNSHRAGKGSDFMSPSNLLCGIRPVFGARRQRNGSLDKHLENLRG